ncbi:hypothetical protein [Erythrobacter alti]|uniref:hypothetical protein n=1 Tax=Erythrobacter alti TaxID=1896145 RepID=UPI0030F43347
MTDWFRNTDWDDEIEAAFFAKLDRARSQRDQYIVLQAHHLSQTHPEVALRLIDLYNETRKEDFHDIRAERIVAAAKFAMGGYVEALDDYLKMLGRQDDDQPMFVGSPLEFAFLAARFRSETHYAAALAQLDSMEPPNAKQVEPYFRYCAAIALIDSETGSNPTNALANARIALDTPQVVLDYYPDMVWRLRGITRS